MSTSQYRFKSKKKNEMPKIYLKFFYLKMEINKIEYALTAGFSQTPGRIPFLQGG